MRKSVQIRQDLQTKLDAQGAIVEGAKDDKGQSRSLTQEETTNFNNLQKEIETLRSELTLAETHEKNAMERATMKAPVTTETGEGETKEKEKVYRSASILKAIRGANPAMDEKLEGAEKEMHEIGLEETRNADVNLPKGGNIVSIPLRYLSVNRAS